MLSDTFTLNKITVMFRSMIRVQVWCDNTRVVLCWWSVRSIVFVHSYPE